MLVRIASGVKRLLRGLTRNLGARITKVKSEGIKEVLGKLLGQYVTFYCVNYIYAGKVTRVLDDCVMLSPREGKSGAEIVYNTGSHSDDLWGDAREFKKDWFVKFDAIESFGEFKCG